MKTRYYITVIFSVLLAACSPNKEKKEQSDITYEMLETAFRLTLTANDTLAVLNAGDSLMAGLKRGDLESSIRKLYMFQAGEIVPLNEEKVQGLVHHFKRFPVLDYTLRHCVFSIESLNDLKYTIVSDKNDRTPGISFVLNPVKQDSIWYLCIKEMNHSSKDMLNPIHPKTPVN